MSFRGVNVDFGLAVYTGHDDNGYPVTQYDAYGSEDTTGGSNAGVGAQPTSHTFGFYGRLRDPEKAPDGNVVQGSVGNILLFHDGDDTRVFTLDDPRVTQLLPVLKPGGSVQYGYTKANKVSFHVIDGEDGDQTIFVPVGDKAHQVRVGFDANDKPIVSLTHADGQGIELFEKKIVLKASGGTNYIELSNDKIVLNGNVTVTGGLNIAPKTSKALVTVDDLKNTLGALINVLQALPPTAPPTVGAATITALQTVAGTINATLQVVGTLSTKSS